MLVVSAFALVAAFSAPADAHDWRALNQLPGRMIGIDTLSIAEAGGMKQLTAVGVWSEPQEEGMVYSTSRWEFDCAGERHRLLSSEDYGAAGERVGSTEPTDWMPVRAGTINGLLADAACKGQWAQGTPHYPELTDYVVAMQGLLAK